MKNIKTLLILGLLGAFSAFGQLNTLTSTTTSAIQLRGARTISLTSATNITAGTQLYVVDPGQAEGEVENVTSITGTTATVTRNTSKVVPHVSGALVIAGSPQWFYKYNPTGSCVTASEAVSPWINTITGGKFTCDPATLSWVESGDRVFYVPPTQCTTAPTTSTVTNTYPQIGASNVFVLNATTNSAAGTTTLTCDILVPGSVTATRGAYLKDIVVAVGSQTTAPTSIGTATMATITFPTPVATTQTASTVTPVAAGGTITQLGPTTTVATVTTAGAFLTFKYSPATPISLGTDLQILQFTVPYLQSAAAVMTLNFPGLWVHYVAPQK